MFSVIRIIKNSVILNNQESKIFLWVFGISLLCLSSLFQANILYLDDLDRVMSGETFWENNGRPLASIVTLIFQLGKPLTDISPLPQIICVGLYSLSFVLIAKIYGIKNQMLVILSGIIFVINPYNLGIYSFVFDSFTMGLGLFTAVMAFILVTIGIEKIKNRFNKILLFLLATISLFLSLCLYQPTSAFYLVIFSLYLLNKLLDKKSETKWKKSLMFCSTYTCVLISSLIIYLPIKKIYVTADKYANKHSQIPSLNLILPNIIKNLSYSWEYIQYHLSGSILLVLINSLIIVIGLIFLAVHFQNFIIKNKHSKLGFDVSLVVHFLANLLIGLFYILILFISFVFPSFLLVNPPWTTRIFMGFSGVIGFGSLFVAKYCSFNKLFYLYGKYLIVFFFSLIILSFTNLSLTHGNLIYSENFYHERVGTLIISDIESTMQKLNLPSNSKIQIAFADTENIDELKKHNLTIKAFEKYPILYSINFPYFNAGGFGMQKFKTMGLSFKQVYTQDLSGYNQDYYVPQTKPIINRQLYQIYLENNIFIVVFKS